MTDVQCVTAVAAEVGVGDHLPNGLDPGNRLLRKRKAQRDGTYQLAVNVNGATAHTLQNTCLLQRPSAKPGQDDCLLGPDVLDDSENFNLKFFDSVALEYRAADTVESRMNILQREKVLSGRDNLRSGNNQSRYRQQFAQNFGGTALPRSNHILMHISSCSARWLETLFFAS
jgi:hypothetical protein